MDAQAMPGATQAKILCLNLNAAIDKTLVVSRFEINRIHRPESSIVLAGGKGCNVARALKALGAAPVVSGWTGGFAGKFIEAELEREGIETDLMDTDFESRTCTSILDQVNHTITEIYELGVSIPTENIERLRESYQQNVKHYHAVTLSGSLPPGVPVDFYAELIEIARNENVLTFLDTSGAALRTGVEAQPDFVKPNLTEAQTLLGCGAPVIQDYYSAAADIALRYKTTVVLSLGPEGAVSANESGVVEVDAPAVAVKSAVGSGDCLLAGFVYGITTGESLQSALEFGVAAGTANTLVVGAGRFLLEDYLFLLNQIRFRDH